MVNARATYKKAHSDAVEQWLFDMQLAKQLYFGADLLDRTETPAEYDQDWVALGELCEEHGRPEEALKRADKKTRNGLKPLKHVLQVRQTRACAD